MADSLTAAPSFVDKNNVSYPAVKLIDDEHQVELSSDKDKLSVQILKSKSGFDVNITRNGKTLKTHRGYSLNGVKKTLETIFAVKLKPEHIELIEKLPNYQAHLNDKYSGLMDLVEKVAYDTDFIDNLHIYFVAQSEGNKTTMASVKKRIMADVKPLQKYLNVITPFWKNPVSYIPVIKGVLNDKVKKAMMKAVESLVDEQVENTRYYLGLE